MNAFPSEASLFTAAPHAFKENGYAVDGIETVNNHVRAWRVVKDGRHMRCQFVRGRWSVEESRGGVLSTTQAALALQELLR